MATFGGFSNSGELSDWLTGGNENGSESNLPDFVKMVVSYSALLAAYSDNLDEVSRIALKQVYPRIGLILAAARNLDNTRLFPTYESVVTTMTAPESVFSEGITATAAMMTAAILIRQLPLNGDIKNIDLGNELDKAANVDLNRIVDLIKSTTIAVAADATSSSTQASPTTIYIGLDIDKTTLPSTVFDIDPTVEPLTKAITVQDLIPPRYVSPLSELTIPSSKVAFGWLYFSSTEGEALTTTGSTLSVTPPVEAAFFIRDGYTADDVIEIISDEINGATLNADANILCSPNRGDLTLKNFSIPKKKLYDSTVTTFDRKRASFNMLTQLDYLSFDARRMSTIVSRELIILKFYSIDKVKLAKLINPAAPSFNYVGDWILSTNYIAGDTIDFGSSLYVCKVNNTSTSLNKPGTTAGSSIWARVFSSAEDLVSKKSFCDGFIDGLVYGLNPSYNFLDKRGPKSLTLNVDKGTVKSLAAAKTTTPGTTVADKYSSDTFWFRLVSPAPNPASGDNTLVIRVSSTSLVDHPELAFITGFNSPGSPLNSLTVDLSNYQSSSEDVSLEILKKLYLMGQSTDVLSALVQPSAIQLTAFKKTDGEVKEVIDILKIPDWLEVATGTAEEAKTEYKSKPRSIIILAEPIKGLTGSSVTSSKSKLPDNKDYGVIATSQGEKSHRLQNVYDRLDLLKNVRPNNNVI